MQVNDSLSHEISYPPRCWCTNLTAIAPSPTAEATRLTEPERTSPAAKTPGADVSKRLGARPTSAQPFSTSTGFPCGNEAVLAQRYIAVEPARMRGRADENEQRAKVESSLCGMRGCSSYEKGSTSIHMLSPEKVASTDPFSSKSRRDIARTGNIFADLSATFKIEKAPFKRY